MRHTISAPVSPASSSASIALDEAELATVTGGNYPWYLSFLYGYDSSGGDGGGAGGGDGCGGDGGCGDGSGDGSGAL